MPVDLAQALEALAGTLRIVLPTPPAAGSSDPVTATVAPPQLPALELVEIVASNVDLSPRLDPFTSLSKNVDWVTPRPEAPQATGTSFENLDKTDTTKRIDDGIPEVTSITGGFATLADEAGVFAQVSRLIGHVTGTIPIPIKTSLPVGIAVSWSVGRTANGPALTPGTDFLAPDGLDALQATFVLPPTFEEATGAPPAWFLRATARVTAGDLAETVTLPPVELKPPRLSLTALVREAYRADARRLDVPAGAPPAAGVPVELPVGAPARAELVAVPVENALTALTRRFPGISVAFAYTLTRAGQPPVSGEVVTPSGGALPASGALGLGSALDFRLRPRLEPLSAQPGRDEWSLTVRATVTGLPGAGGPLQVDLPTVVLHQLALPVPQLLLAFKGKKYGPPTGGRQEAYAFLAPDHPLASNVVVDRRSEPGVHQSLVSALIGQIDAMRKALALVDTLFAPDPSWLPFLNVDVLEKVLGALASCKYDDVVIDGTAACRDLGQRDPGWNDAISSVAMIGLPHDRVLSLFKDHDFTGNKVSLFVPRGHLLATYWTVHESWASDSVPAGVLSGAVAPSAGNEDSSSRWEGPVQGLKGEYFEGVDLDPARIKQTRLDPNVDFGWGAGRPDPIVADNEFSVRWTGLLWPRFSETYTFSTLSDDGVRLWVADQALVDNWTNHGETRDEGTIALTADQPVSVKMEYYDRAGAATARLLWSSPSQPEEPVPPDRLEPPPV